MWVLFYCDSIDDFVGFVYVWDVFRLLFKD